MANDPNNGSAAPLPWYAYPYVLLQYLLPHHLVSALVYRLTRVRWRPFKDLFIRRFIALYGVDMDEARDPDPAHYPTFNAFFTRPLRPDVRPLDPDPAAVLCPADGTLSQGGVIEDGRIFQAKGRDYSLTELLGGDEEWAARFRGGRFATVYLSPRDYHRLHMPLDGELRQMLHVPGRLFSVNPTTTRLVPRLFARNERVVCLFETPAGPMAQILVGAINVASIDTVWAGSVAPHSRGVSDWHYAADKPVRLARGDEMGRFNMGSTVILLFPPDRVEWDAALQAGVRLRMGGRIGRTLSPQSSTQT